ncbi:hypothetical protein PtA15_5A394 [Puccinia triticina]|uniref:Uncharacterized protein n=1 Tax=Puccinia triticina TaxID=208348 RepID=A0ABY7CL07_9BASI|nr:uncharacterized protein PtA15_5A394 [Puccinia triticina]WAQ84821.1 hypothetical protein PtA15_5A394 [Puccinia triticina]
MNQLRRTLATITSRTPPPQRLRYANNPSELIIRIQQLTRTQQPLQLIIQLIKASSIRVATISVWTELFKLLITHQQQNQAYKLFLDIKRRQIKPDHIFFHHFLHLITTTPQPAQKHFSPQRITAIYQQALQAAETPAHRTSLGNLYLQALIHHHHHPEALDAFNSLLTTNTADPATIYQITQALSPTNKHHLNRARTLIESLTTNTTLLDLRTTLALANLFLRSTDPADHQYAAELVEKRLGIELAPNPYKFWTKTTQPILRGPQDSPDSPDPKQKQQTIRFEPGQLTTLLRMLLKMHKFALVRRLWTQISANPDLYLQRDAIDSTHCGLVMFAMGRCQAMNEVEALLRWMIEAGTKRLRPTGDTLDKALQAAWQTEDVEAGIAVLASLTQTYTGLVAEEQPPNALVALARTTKSLAPLTPSNRALATLLQAAGRRGRAAEIGRTLDVVARFRRLPAADADDAEPPTTTTTTTTTCWRGTAEPAPKVARYWADQFVWVLTDLLDKLLARPDRARLFAPPQIARFEAWRAAVDGFLQADSDPLKCALRARIELRALERAQRRALIAAQRSPPPASHSSSRSYRPSRPRPDTASYPSGARPGRPSSPRPLSTR